MSQKKLEEIIGNKDLAKELEEGIKQWTEEYNEANMIPEFMFENIYQDKFNEIIKNLDPEFNPTLLDRIKTKSISAKKLPFMKPEEIFPEKYEEILKKKMIEKAKLENQASSELFTCPKCKAKKSRIEQKQTRSGDEPMTTFVTCLECGLMRKF